MRPDPAHLLLLTVLLATSGAAAEDHVVVQKDSAFSTAELAVRRGDRVVFENRDTRTHNVFSRTPGFEFEIKAQIPGQSASVPVEATGRADVRCAIHPDMKLTLIVEP